ncbi:MAG: hypothetical protein VYA89_07655 [Actinomycetota bacterium]|nr:hypothetical protein [Actinomycetota bacterium]
MMSRGVRPAVVLSVAALVLGGWITVVPFDRPLPGGAPFSLEATPAVGCRTPLLGMLGDDRPAAEVFTTPRPKIGDPTVMRSIDCTARARFRVALGGFLLVAGLVGLAASRPRSSTTPSGESSVP